MNKSNRRYYRTIGLGLVAMAALVWVAMEQFSMPREDLLQLLLGMLLATFMIILFAALIVAMWVGLRRLSRRDTGPD